MFPPAVPVPHPSSKRGRVAVMEDQKERSEEFSINVSDDRSASDDPSRAGSYGIDSSVSDSHHGSGGGNYRETAEAEIIASKVSKQVFWLKMTVMFVLLIAAVLVAAAIYLSTHRSEVSSFEAAFDDHASKVFSTFKFNVERKLGAIDALSVAITSLSVDTNATWPFFTIPDFEYRAANVRELADAASIALLPIVTLKNRDKWEQYSIVADGWIEDAEFFEQTLAQRDRMLREPREIAEEVHGHGAQIFRLNQNGSKMVDETNGPYYPIWQHSPIIRDIINYNVESNDNFKMGIDQMINTGRAVIGKVWDTAAASNDVFVAYLDAWGSSSGLDAQDPLSKVFYPVFDSLNQDHSIAAVLASVLNWKTFFENILPPRADGLVCVVANECDQVFTYQVNGEDAIFLGYGDLHDLDYDDMGQSQKFSDLIQPDDRRIQRFTDVVLDTHFCEFSLSIYPSDTLEEDFITSQALIYTVCVVVIFGFTGIVFLIYDCIVERRQQMVMKRAVQSRAIVSSLFPAAVRDRLFRNDDSSQSDKNRLPGMKRKADPNKTRIKNFLHDSAPEERRPLHELRPIADLFPHTTVMFADIAGFTRWSSDRDPAHVFTLLQTVYHAFDRIAKKRGVFKVETIGDCYVAVTGLPDPQEDHAVRMAKFASECMKKMSELVLKLKESLGEDTGELCMRFGLHSGPVTAGVLRGEKSRFQLFGNTVNTAARMEHTGQRKKIQVTQETADLITEAGKGHWIYQRIDDIAARGGIQTYWVEPQTNAQEAKHKNAAPTRVANKPGGSVDNSQRLIDWNVDILKRLLKRLIAHRRDQAMDREENPHFGVNSEDGTTVRDEVVESIPLPKFDKKASKTDPDTVVLSEEVERQLRDYVTIIESMYRDNSFHSFKHASNVCTSANKMLCSIVDEDLSKRTSDPLTQFAVVFSALIHDVDHAGITNMQLIKEKPHIAALYRNKSVAEQNSVDLAWNLLMDPEYEALQDTIFSSKAEFERFRKLVVNVIMATDIFDKELNADRASRWLMAFDKDARTEEMSDEDEGNLRATVIIEHCMQAADVMHTMQHFHSYQRWNERLFEEMYGAYASGRTRKDPSLDWYEGEIWFFDNCVIPLAQRIKDCGIFGAQGDDCLKNAISNKKDWAVKGAQIVVELVKKFQEKQQTRALAAEEEEKKDEHKEQVSETKPKEPNITKENQDKHMVEWNMDLFKRMLRHILAHRMESGSDNKEDILNLATTLKEGSTVRDELVRSINMPVFDKIKVDPETIELSKAVEDQLRDYIVFIASMYRDIPFHNFKHASNVSMSANKYLQRIVDDTLAKQAADPLTHFAVIFSALVHDVDHTGVSNMVLVKEKQRVAALYDNKSIAEQNSVDLAWTVLMDADYKDLQSAIYSNEEEFDRFRRIVVNTILATDLFDEELAADRDERWKQAFGEKNEEMSAEEHQNLKATVVMEYLMQASDIGHTMQHFHSYRRWNERLFQETYAAFEEGRIENDPSKDWYEGEIMFFDKYVIPLAKKLKESGMLGIAGDDAFTSAQANRKEWVVKGVAIVQEHMKHYKESKESSA